METGNRSQGISVGLILKEAGNRSQGTSADFDGNREQNSRKAQVSHFDENMEQVHYSNWNQSSIIDFSYCAVKIITSKLYAFNQPEPIKHMVIGSTPWSQIIGTCLLNHYMKVTLLKLS